MAEAGGASQGLQSAGWQRKVRLHWLWCRAAILGNSGSTGAEVESWGQWQLADTPEALGLYFSSSAAGATIANERQLGKDPQELTSYRLISLQCGL